MDIIYNFLADYYVIFGIISLFFLLSLIGIISSKPIQKKEEDPSSQPIKMEEEKLNVDNPLVDKPKQQVVSSIPQTSIQNATKEQFIEPTLDNLESTATEVKINTDQNINNSQETLIINDTITQTTQVQNEPTLIIEEQPQSSTTQEFSLVIEDNNTEEINNTQENIQMEDNGLDSSGMLVIEDTSTIDEASNVPESKQVKKEQEAEELAKQQSIEQANIKEEEKSIFEE